MIDRSAPLFSAEGAQPAGGAPDFSDIPGLVRLALGEDLGGGDVTSAGVIPAAARARGLYRAKQALTVAGLPVAAEVARQVDPALEFRALVEEGAAVAPGAELAEIRGSARAILAAERTSLNFLQRMCGTATATAAYVQAVQGTRARILDTRKTAPGFRKLDKYAVRCGGGTNHRAGLYDAILIKNNHLVFHGGVRSAVRAAEAAAPAGLEIEVEVRTPRELAEALEAGATWLLLDNLTPEETREAVRATAGRARLESSGGITLANVRAYAETGVDFISIGALTHSVIAADIHLQVIPLSDDK